MLREMYVLMLGFMWVKTMEYALEVTGFNVVLKIHIYLAKEPLRGIIKYSLYFKFF
jgi:hypothetical protein